VGWSFKNPGKCQLFYLALKEWRWKERIKGRKEVVAAPQREKESRREGLFKEKNAAEQKSWCVATIKGSSSISQEKGQI